MTSNNASEQVELRWFIDLDWYQQNNRSFLTLARGYLCAKCRKKLKGREISVTELLSILKNCCSKTPNFITDTLTIAESVFRFFLAKGNQSLSLEELGKQLGEWRGGDTYRTSPEILSRLLERDQYYGFRQVKD